MGLAYAPPPPLFSSSMSLPFLPACLSAGGPWGGGVRGVWTTRWKAQSRDGRGRRGTFEGKDVGERMGCACAKHHDGAMSRQHPGGDVSRGKRRRGNIPKIRRNEQKLDKVAD